MPAQTRIKCRVEQNECKKVFSRQAQPCNLSFRPLRQAQGKLREIPVGLGDQVLGANHSLLSIAQKTFGVPKSRFTSTKFLTRDQNYSSASDLASLLMPDNFRLVILVPLTYMSGMRQAYSIGRGGTVVGGALSLLHSHAEANFSSRAEERTCCHSFH